MTVSVTKYVQRIDGEDYPVLLVKTSLIPGPEEPDDAVCEGCGQDVNIYFTTDLEATDPDQPGVSECLPCFFEGEWESLKPRR